MELSGSSCTAQYRVCARHMMEPAVVLKSHRPLDLYRFCNQCCKFELLVNFDGTKSFGRAASEPPLPIPGPAARCNTLELKDISDSLPDLLLEITGQDSSCLELAGEELAAITPGFAACVDHEMASGGCGHAGTQAALPMDLDDVWRNLPEDMSFMASPSAAVSPDIGTDAVADPMPPPAVAADAERTTAPAAGEALDSSIDDMDAAALQHQLHQLQQEAARLQGKIMMLCKRDKP
eukprot:gene5533-5769_t